MGRRCFDGGTGEITRVILEGFQVRDHDCRSREQVPVVVFLQVLPMDFGLIKTVLVLYNLSSGVRASVTWNLLQEEFYNFLPTDVAQDVGLHVLDEFDRANSICYEGIMRVGVGTEIYVGQSVYVVG